jgi:hypothetical protein
MASVKNKCTGIVRSHQRVPLLSEVAMRSGTGTKSGETGFVTFSTKAIIDFFATPSFQDGSGSVLANAVMQIKRLVKNPKRDKEVFIR